MTAQCVRELTDEQLIAALKNVGCRLESCDACAEVFFTGFSMHTHTCRPDPGLEMTNA